ncbi:cache domain-containing sensor histidine kinase [Paenibacillus riograndensis]|uniref:Histidine kinase n=1 Tax=Paenibacillus riograndensis SBR5 TaxID=1073571 RepID=A0A0E3WHB6_9BACL|nr:sensor histidine kinase [Paenibacillus riograndensis]CQR55003.1 histidine kinase [Paenibacillus riograndensis SBR5]
MKKAWAYLIGLSQGILSAKNWLLAYVLLILLPVSIMLGTFYQRSNEVLEKEVTRTMQLTLKQAGMNLTYKLNHIRDSSNSVFMNQILYDNLLQKDKITDQLGQIRELRNLAETAQENEDIFRLRFFVEASRMYGGDRINLYPLADMDQYPWYEAVKEAGGGIVWTGVYPEIYNDYGEKKIFSAARLLRNPRDYEEIVGVLVMDVSETLVQEIVSELQFSEKYAPYLLDGRGKLIYGTTGPEGVESDAAAGSEQKMNQLPEDVLSAISHSEEGVVKRTIGRDNVNVVYTTVGTTGWKLVAQVSEAEISHRATALGQFTSIATLAGITVMFLVLVFVLLMFMIQGVQRRVQMILRMIRKEGIGWLEERRSMPDGDFRLLERSVDHLIHKVNNLVEESYQAKIQEREAQLRTLQAQINPHFLYNALDMINWSAISHNAEDTSEMIEALAQYFRLSLNKGRDNVSIEDELELVRVFLEIQQNRFPSTFTFSIQAEPGLESYIIPKLTLQPLVENALLHGIRKTKSKQGTIEISVRLENGDVVLTVADDGIGMDPKQANRLLLEPAAGQQADGMEGSFGLYNVQERIRYFAGNRYGLSIETEPGKGTVVRVAVKAVLRK